MFKSISSYFVENGFKTRTITARTLQCAPNKGEKMKNRKIILLLLIILIAVLGIVKLIKKDTLSEGLIDNYENVQNDTELNIFELQEPIRIEEEKIYKNLIISNIEIQLISDRQCEIRADVRNETNKVIEMQDIKIKVYDKNGNMIDVLGAQIDSVEAGGHTKLYALVRKNDISDIAQIEIEEN